MEIKIHSKKYGARVIQIDAEDYDRVAQHTWHLHKMKAKKVEYVMANYGVGFLHRFIMKPNDSQQVDHKNGNGLDCRKSNLRVCSNSQNQMNKKMYKRSGLKGVCFDKGMQRRKRYKAGISVNGKRVHLGYYESETSAANAYNNAANLYHGEFAQINQI